MHEKELNPQTYLDDNNAYHFFEQTDGLLITGATQTNVMDVVVVTGKIVGAGRADCTSVAEALARL